MRSFSTSTSAKSYLPQTGAAWIQVPKVTVPRVNPYALVTPGRNKHTSEVSSYSYSNPAKVVSPGGKYLGSTTANPYDSDSINNLFGRYGSKYSADSVNNPFGRFGSEYSSESANNPYATNAPQLVGQRAGEYRGKLSANKYDSESIENRFSPKHDEPLAKQRELTRATVIDAYADDPAGFLKEYRSLSSTQQKTILDLLKEE